MQSRLVEMKIGLETGEGGLGGRMWVPHVSPLYSLSTFKVQCLEKKEEEKLVSWRVGG